LLVSIYCFSNIYIERGIITDDPVTHDSYITHDSYDAIYFSIVTWTTLGYGDFRPTPDARAWAAAEAFSGYLFMGILVGLIIGLLIPRKSEFSGRAPHLTPRQWWAVFSVLSFVGVFIAADFFIQREIESTVVIIGLTAATWLALIGFAYLAGLTVAWVRRRFKQSQ